jgi:hypothetical protein
MADRDSMAERGRALEEEYFRKKDRELIEKMRQAAAAEQARAELGRTIGIDVPQLVDELQSLGFTPETVALLPLMPVIEVAWAEGGVTPAERELIARLARNRGIAQGTAADRQLSEWTTTRPSDDVFARSRRLIRAMLDSGSGQTDVTADDLVKYCEEIASASGGVFGIGRMSAEERQLLAGIAADLRARRS